MLPVCGLQRKAAAEAAQNASDQRVVFGECGGVFEIEVGAGEGKGVDVAGCADHIKARAFRAGVTQIKNKLERECALDIEIPGLHIG